MPHVISALRPSWAVPGFPGAERTVSIDDLELGDAPRVLVRSGYTDRLPLGRRVAVLGHDLIALQLATHLANGGHEVTVIDEAGKFGHGVALVKRWRLLHSLREKGAALLTGARDIEVFAGGLRYRNASEQLRSIDVDDVVVATAGPPYGTLAQSLRGNGLQVQTIGDCAGLGYIDGAMRAAADAVAALADLRVRH